MEEKVYKLSLTLIVSLSLGSGPPAQNETRKPPEAFSGMGDMQVQVFDEVGREKELEEVRRKKFPNFSRDIHGSQKFTLLCILRPDILGTIGYFLTIHNI